MPGLADRHVHPKSGQRPLDYFPLGDPAEVALEKREVGLGVRAEGDVEVGGSRVLGCTWQEITLPKYRPRTAPITN